MNEKLTVLANVLERIGVSKSSEQARHLKDEGCLKIGMLDDSHISNGLKYHLDNNQSLFDPVFRHASDEYFNLMKEAAKLYKRGSLYLEETDQWLMTPDIGSFAEYEGVEVPLDFPMEIFNSNINKSADNSDKPIGKPKKNSGGGKKWVVYVRNPKTGNVKKITYGDGNMKANWNDPEARKSFAARHKCSTKKDRMTAGYWSCRAHKDFGKNVSGRYW